MTKPSKNKMTKEEAEELQAYLESQGMSKQDAKALVKENDTREKVSDNLRGWLKTRPKKK